MQQIQHETKSDFSHVSKINKTIPYKEIQHTKKCKY